MTFNPTQLGIDEMNRKYHTDYTPESRFSVAVYPGFYAMGSFFSDANFSSHEAEERIEMAEEDFYLRINGPEMGIDWELSDLI
jgi:hypothetical protein